MGEDAVRRLRMRSASVRWKALVLPAREHLACILASSKMHAKCGDAGEARRPITT